MQMIFTLLLVFLSKVCLPKLSIGYFAYISEIFRHVRTVSSPYIDVELPNDEHTMCADENF